MIDRETAEMMALGATDMEMMSWTLDHLGFYPRPSYSEYLRTYESRLQFHLDWYLESFQ